MRVLRFVCLVFFSVAGTSVHAAMQPGDIRILDRCPGDTIAAEEATGNEALLEALLTPLLTGVVSSGLKLAGEKLKEQAAEAQVDVLHKGAHFYTWRESAAQGKPEYWDVTGWCLVIASKQTKATKRTVAQMVEGYKLYAITVAGDGDRKLAGALDGESELVKELGRIGFDGETTPGLLAVLDVQLSSQKSEFRLTPRFVVLDHSIREKKVDKRQRDITLEFSYAIPGAADPVAKGLLNMEGLRIDGASVDAANVQDPESPGIASHWMTLPPLNESEKTKRTNTATLRSQQKTHAAAAELAAAAAVALGANTWVDPEDSKTWKPVERGNSCPDFRETRPGWVRAHALLQNEKSKAKPSSAVVSRWTNLVTYFESCNKSQAAKTKITNTGTKVDALARSFDLTVAIKEFRQRPVAKFFGEILADGDTNKALTTGIIGAIDPGTRDAQAKADADARIVLLKAYEDAILKAEVSMLAYESAKPDEKAAKLLQMNYDQRGANRAAQILGIALPYPGAGTWLGN